MEIALHIILQKPPAGVSFGLQKGSGAKYDTIQIQRTGPHDMHFYLTATIKGDAKTDPSPGFTGPSIQGPPIEKFIYLDIGTYAGIDEQWSRRLKIPLRGITWQMINELVADDKLRLETCVPGTGKDGSPNCATVKPFDGWNLKAV
jgi:hypothetical protein